MKLELRCLKLVSGCFIIGQMERLCCVLSCWVGLHENLECLKSFGQEGVLEMLLMFRWPHDKCVHLVPDANLFIVHELVWRTLRAITQML